MHGLSGLYGAARTEASLRNGISAPVWAFIVSAPADPDFDGSRIH